MERVVITGMGVVSPVGNDVETFWNHLINGQSGISQLTNIREDQKVKIGGKVAEFDYEDFISKKEAKKLDRFSLFALKAADEAWRQAKLEEEAIDKERLGVYVGSGIGGIQTLVDNVEVIHQKGVRRVSPLLVPNMIANAAAAQISIKYGAMGATLSPVTACAIGNTAIGEAFQCIRWGEADVIIAGGTEAAITDISLASFGNATALSARNEEPTKASRPFEISRDGFVMGEGAGILILESLSHALKRNAPIYGEVIGYGISTDAHHMVSPHPEGKGALLAMQKAVKNAQISPNEIDVISAHATSTIQGDRAETMAIKGLLGSRAYDVPVTANKSMIGHMFGAAGGVEAIALTKSLQEGIIPPTINLEEQDPYCDLDYVANEKREATLSIGLSNSFGFGGHNAVIVLKKYKK